MGEKQKGLISYNNSGKIKHYNLLAKGILGTTEEKLTGANILDIFSSLSIRQALMDMKPGQKKRFFLNGQYVQIQVFAENDTIAPRTNYMTLETLGAARERGKTPIPGRGYRAKHDFSDIIICSESMKKLMGLAERNAKKDSSILITGEISTGKELMAQAIHNASPRSRNLLWQLTVLLCRNLCWRVSCLVMKRGRSPVLQEVVKKVSLNRQMAEHCF